MIFSVPTIKMNRKGFGLKSQIRGDLHAHYFSPLIREIKAEGFSKKFGDVTIHLASEFGFCYGVDRAVELAYETRKKFPHKKIFLSAEIIHNPLVNSNLKKMGIHFLSGPYKDADLEELNADDVVIIPAFGTTIGVLEKLTAKKCELVDTICASVIVVWKRVEKYAKEGFTVLIHGKYLHEETQAAISRVAMFPDGKYLVVFDKKEAQMVCGYIAGKGEKEQFVSRFSARMSCGFDPDCDLEKIGLANQTTMLSSESSEISEMVGRALATRYGEENLKNHFHSFDTICNATQQRQDAVIALAKKKPDLVLVIGGYNSSNTNHLSEISAKLVPTYHIDIASCLVSADVIRHKPVGEKNEIAFRGWLKEGPVSIGITAGASTPNQVMGEAIERILSFR